MVPSAHPASENSPGTPEFTKNLLPVSSSRDFVIISNFETAQIDARASPLKPREFILSRSSAVFNLLVAWRRKAFFTSSLYIPQPLSEILISFTPPFFISATI